MQNQKGTTKACTHEHPEVEAQLYHVRDEDRWQLHVTARCTDCGEPFRFLALPYGRQIDKATVNPSGLEVRLPVVPNSQSVPRKLKGRGKRRGRR